jgi:hypothetical protein
MPRDPPKITDLCHNSTSCVTELFNTLEVMMRSFKNNLMGCMAMLLIGICVTIPFAQEYPVKPGSAAKSALCQIQEGELAKMTTEELIEAYFDCPHTAIIAAYDNLQVGFEKFYQRFNGLPELLDREDAARKLIARYKTMDPGGYNENWELYEIGKFCAEFVHMEILLAQNVVLGQLSESEMKELLFLGIEKYESKQQHVDIHGLYGLKFSALPLGRLMREREDIAYFQGLLDTQGMGYFLDTIHLQNIEILLGIIRRAKEFLHHE